MRHALNFNVICKASLRSLSKTFFTAKVVEAAFEVAFRCIYTLTGIEQPAVQYENILKEIIDKHNLTKTNIAQLLLKFKNIKL